MHRATQITKCRGVPVRDKMFGATPVFPMFSPSFVLRILDHVTALNADLNTLARFRAANWDIASISGVAKNYRWDLDVGAVAAELLARVAAGEEPVITVDTETTSLNVREAEVLTVQITTEPGRSYVVPVDQAYFPALSLRRRALLINQLKSMLENPRIRKIGHNCVDEETEVRRLGVVFGSPRRPAGHAV